MALASEYRCEPQIQSSGDRSTRRHDFIRRAGSKGLAGDEDKVWSGDGFRWAFGCMILINETGLITEPLFISFVNTNLTFVSSRREELPVRAESTRRRRYGMPREGSHEAPVRDLPHFVRGIISSRSNQCGFRIQCARKKTTDIAPERAQRRSIRSPELHEI